MIELARASLGVPFKRYGRNLKTGLSCIGLVTEAAKVQGVECPILDHASFVPYHPANRPVSDAIARDLQRINLSEARVGDVLLFHIRNRNGLIIEHTALISGVNPLTIIQAQPWLQPGVIEHELDTALSASQGFFVVGAYRFKETQHE